MRIGDSDDDFLNTGGVLNFPPPPPILWVLIISY
ncbi:hypothetical protein G5S_0941 [Chlamydia pecorum E58]|uniref:Uncharacterized protein n=1 Tax=Chlamydia pecorum (strain ATCC VR-628 / DSM 29919 / E58) TaxID=331635 RepID=A0AA34RDR4_CHLPE|nr:hypothetical protein G5S_0941 [Chlamydia pecorum E58]